MLKIRTAQVEEITHTLEQFQSASDRLDYIELELYHLYTTSNLMPLREYPIRALMFSQYMDDNFNMTQLNEYTGFGDLTQLTLNKTNVNFINSKIFEYFPKLQALILNCNHIEKIVSGAFDDASALIKLDFSYNRLDLLSENILRGLVRNQYRLLSNAF